nr:hydrogenase maturation nickel metallochaperone HypA [Candidatus Njordarchaeota archaeon]
MHEFSVTQQIVQTVLEEAKKHDAKRVTSVHLIIGKLTFLGIDQIKFSYRLLVKGTIMEHSKLLIEHMEPTVNCASCGYEGPAKYMNDPSFHFSIPTLTCPKCSAQVTIKLGRECTIKNIGIVTNGEDGSAPPNDKGG